MNIYIKNMVCNRCVMVVSKIFHEVGLTEAEVQLGKVYVTEPISDAIFLHIERQMKNAGSEIINDSKSRLIEQIKKIAIDIIYNHPTEVKLNYYEYLAGQLNLDYNYSVTQ